MPKQDILFVHLTDGPLIEKIKGHAKAGKVSVDYLVQTILSRCEDLNLIERVAKTGYIDSKIVE